MNLDPSEVCANLVDPAYQHAPWFAYVRQDWLSFVAADMTIIEIDVDVVHRKINTKLNSQT